MTQDETIEMAREAGIRDTICDGKWGCLERFANLVAAKEREALAQEQCKYPDCKCPTENPCLKGLAQPEQEPVAWPCVIAESDFSQNTVTLEMQCTDYKVSAGKHWLCTTPPQRTWVGLTNEEELKLAQDSMGKSRHWLVAQVEAKLKQKNGFVEEKNT